jgi:hypothetical protein
MESARWEAVLQCNLNPKTVISEIETGGQIWARCRIENWMLFEMVLIHKIWTWERWEEQERQQGVVCVFLQISVEIASGFGININMGSRFDVQMAVMRYCICPRGLQLSSITHWMPPLLQRGFCIPLPLLPFSSFIIFPSFLFLTSSLVKSFWFVPYYSLCSYSQCIYVQSFSRFVPLFVQVWLFEAFWSRTPALLCFGASLWRSFLLSQSLGQTSIVVCTFGCGIYTSFEFRL